MDQIKVIAFDADDTLWVNEPYFRETEDKFCEMMEDYLPQHSVSRELLETEINNLALYGYGIKSMTLSMIEAAIQMSDKTIGLEAVEKIIQFGKEMLDKPIELLEGVEEVLQALQGKYRLVMATKGDLLDQERKLLKSGLANYFHHIEIVSEKKEPNYERLIQHLDIPPQAFLMVGNSLKSDIMPVLNLGGHAFHVPYHTTWAYEKVDNTIDHLQFKQLSSIKDVIKYL
ncbi:HAD family hydrolase [Tunicatimonas pelagia]|uniref:HAD family hydrolase n=1 Tax=Tunicatimonas pelagia TaxID=931531 RepID=UPI002665394C|nr:HAD family hydrolase [Tunicatimonas pelagia]WKN45030.1 HAD family hydrolase [Tunicatimonas pelagia]